MQSKGRLKIFRRPFLMPAYFHFSNSPPPFNRHTHRIPLFIYLFIYLSIYPYPTPHPSSNELNSSPSRDSRPPRFPYFSDDPNAV